MKIEKFKKPATNGKPTMSNALRLLKAGDAMRLKTAGEYRNYCGICNAVTKSLKIKFGTVLDGDDVLVFIKDKP